MVLISESMVDVMFMVVNGLDVMLIVESVVHGVVIFFMIIVVATVLMDVVEGFMLVRE